MTSQPSAAVSAANNLSTLMQQQQLLLQMQQSRYLFSQAGMSGMPAAAAYLGMQGKSHIYLYLCVLTMFTYILLITLICYTFTFNVYFYLHLQFYSHTYTYTDNSWVNLHTYMYFNLKHIHDYTLGCVLSLTLTSSYLTYLIYFNSCIYCLGRCSKSYC